MNIFELMQFCVQSRHTSSQKEFSMHKVNKCSIVVSFEGVCALLSPPAFCLFLLETVEMQIGVTTKKNSYNNNNTVFQISGKKNLYPSSSCYSF
jgi:hypothetical protein